MAAVAIPDTGLSLPLLMQIILDSSSRSFEIVRWIINKGNETHTLKVKNKNYILIVEREGNYYKVRFKAVEEDSAFPATVHKLKLTGQEFAQVIEALISRNFR